MSRNISAKASVTITAEETAGRKTEQGKLIFTKYKGHDCALLIHNDRLKAASFFHSGKRTDAQLGNGGKVPAAIGAIYIGKIKNVVKNINACFVEIANGEICFLPMKNAVTPYLVNRTYDGRLLEGDELLVQIERESQKTKQASVTAHISLANDYFVISIGSSKVRYSSNINDETKRKIQFLFTEMAIFSEGCLIQDIRNLLNIQNTENQEEKSPLARAGYKMTLPSTGCIVRTKAAETTDSGALLRHFFSLTAQYAELLHTALHRSCFSCIKEAPSAIENVLQQLAGKEEYQEIVTDDEVIFTQLQKIMDMEEGSFKEASRYSEAEPYMENSKRLRLYQDNLLSLSKLYSVEGRLEEAMERRIWLKSGGYLFVEPTEAMTVIDVNSGKYEAKKGAEESYLKINLEAAEEIVLQLRLRNLSGIIIVDFINMKTEEERRLLLKHLRELVNRDNNALHHKINTTIVDMTPLGLVEITRKKVNKPLAEQWADCQKNRL